MTVFVDTNVFVYAHDHGSPSKRAVATDLLITLASEIVISSQVLSEFYWIVTRKLRPPVDHERARESTAHMTTLPVVPIDGSLIVQAVDTAASHHLSLWDAQIVEAAARAGCTQLITEDLAHGQTIRDVEVVNPFLPAS